MSSGIPTPEEGALAQALRLRHFELEEFEFSVRTIQLLRGSGINTLGELLVKTEAELRAIHGIGDGRIADIKLVLGWERLALGISLPDELPSEGGSSDNPQS